ncbi:MAG: ABC transporter permease [Halanaerobiales bacterium]
MNKQRTNLEKTKKSHETFQSLSQWQLIKRRFLKHKLAVGALIILSLFYFIALFAGFVAPYSTKTRDTSMKNSPPHKINFIDKEGNFHLRPFIYKIEQTLDTESYETTYQVNKNEKYPIYFITKGVEYKLFGLFNTNIHLFGLNNDEMFYLMGSDTMGRDLFSRIVYGAQISLSIGFVGVILSLTLGLSLGGMSAMFGGFIDLLIQRIIEILLSVPRIPLWMALSASLPPNWSPIQVYFAITIILSLLTWTQVARIARGKFLSTKDKDFVEAARAVGASEWYNIVYHLIPNFFSYVLVQLTLSIPAMIIGETALSFLGIGLRPPVVSWGVLLEQAQKMHVVAMQPWLMFPAIFVIITVLCFNFVGDGLRDAADPYNE